MCKIRIELTDGRKMDLELYKDIAPSCLALQEKAGFYTTDRSAVYKEKQEEIFQVL